MVGGQRSAAGNIDLTHVPQAYVKGFEIDWDKIKALLEITDDNDYTIDAAMEKVMLSVDRDKHWLCGAYPLDGPRKLTNVISLGEDAFGGDLEELEKKEIPIPGYY